MDDSEDAFEEPEKSYLEDLRSHIRFTELHLRGDDGNRLQPSLIRRGSYWTPEEKDAFFHGLAAHSRLRPDLIALDIGTKNKYEVGLYIEALEKAVAEQKRTPVNVHPIAFQMSEEWVEYEKEQSDVISSLEPQWDANSLRLAREAELKSTRASRRSKDEVLADGPLEYDRRERKKRKLEHAKACEARWAREDVVSPVGPVHCKVFNGMLRTAEGAVKEQNEELEDTPPAEAPMTALERRRLAKRNYMRKKRAEASGKPLPDLTSTERLKPGRKTSKKAVQELLYERQLRDSDDSDDDTIVMHGHKNVGGTTAPYSLQKELEEVGVSAAALQTIGVDLINFTSLGCLIKLYLSDNDQNHEVDISLAVLQELQALLVSFIRQLVNLTAVSWEQDVLAKGRSKVWRSKSSDDQEVKPVHVHHAVAILGARRNKMSLFDGYLNQAKRSTSRDPVSRATSSSPPPPEDKEDSPASSSGDESSSSPSSDENTPPTRPIPRLAPSPCRRVMIPFVRLPAGWKDSEDVLSDGFDSEAEEEELIEDAELNEEDMKASESYERSLMDRKDDSQGADADADSGEVDEDEERLAEPALITRPRHNNVKSSQFIEDSD